MRLRAKRPRAPAPTRRTPNPPVGEDETDVGNSPCMERVTRQGAPLLNHEKGSDPSRQSRPTVGSQVAGTRTTSCRRYGKQQASPVRPKHRHEQAGTQQAPGGSLRGRKDEQDPTPGGECGQPRRQGRGSNPPWNGEIAESPRPGKSALILARRQSRGTRGKSRPKEEGMAGEPPPKQDTAIWIPARAPREAAQGHVVSRQTQETVPRQRDHAKDRQGGKHDQRVNHAAGSGRGERNTRREHFETASASKRRGRAKANGNAGETPGGATQNRPRAGAGKPAPTAAGEARAKERQSHRRNGADGQGAASNRGGERHRRKSSAADRGKRRLLGRKGAGKRGKNAAKHAVRAKQGLGGGQNPGVGDWRGWPRKRRRFEHAQSGPGTGAGRRDPARPTSGARAAERLDDSEGGHHRAH